MCGAFSGMSYPKCSDHKSQSSEHDADRVDALLKQLSNCTVHLVLHCLESEYLNYQILKAQDYRYSKVVTVVGHIHDI